MSALSERNHARGSSAPWMSSVISQASWSGRNSRRSHRQAGYDLDRDIGGEWLGSKMSVDDERPPHRVRLHEVEHRLRGVQREVLDSPRFAAELPQTLDVAEVAMRQPDGIQLVQSPSICGCPQDELS